jgi:hypothetical protein
VREHPGVQWQNTRVFTSGTPGCSISSGALIFNFAGVFLETQGVLLKKQRDYAYGVKIIISIDRLFDKREKS